ncbi:hypothetical protein [Pseudomonas sichuanensis]|uniref:Uncharacterized protein n=1 Tax=Pseudomonas sichuanensis TaxID=2213015 RepID=A0ABV0DIU5_9PSED
MLKPRRTNKADSDDLTGVTGLKQMWELACQRCAARAALDFISARSLSANTWRPPQDLEMKGDGLFVLVTASELVI